MRLVWIRGFPPNKNDKLLTPIVLFCILFLRLRLYNIIRHIKPLFFFLVDQIRIIIVFPPLILSRKTARNFNPPMCKAGQITIAEVEEIVENGEIKEEDVHVPHIYVQRVVQGRDYVKRIEVGKGSNIFRKNYLVDQCVTICI